MKYFIYNCLFLVIILLFAYINTKNQHEAFTPKIRELYRPHVRNARIYSEGLYNNNSANISNLFRKFGIM
jgi:preprotein translocase subunit SecG